MKSEFGGLLLDAPDDWGDITPDEDDYPPSLAKDDGVGVLQFSSAEYDSGEQPDIDEDALIALFVNYCAGQKLKITPKRMDGAASICVGGKQTDSKFLTAVWLLTNGLDVALVTYTAEANEPGALPELEVAKKIIASATFPRA